MIRESETQGISFSRKQADLVTSTILAAAYLYHMYMYMYV